MYCWKNIFITGISVLALSVAAYGQNVSKAKIKGLDEQVQEIKTDILAIAAELYQLEEKLLYPSNTQIAIFIAMGDGENFRLDSVDIDLGKKPVAHHIYSFKELEALKSGGVQRIYTGNVRIGEHIMKVTVSGKRAGGSEFRQQKSFTVKKDIGPSIVEITLKSNSIKLKNR